MNTSAAYPTSRKSFHYTPLPSAFQLTEYPVHLCLQKLAYLEALSATLSRRSLLDRVSCITMRVVFFIAGAVVFPICFCVTPVTIIADIVTGLFECTYCGYRGMEKEQIRDLAYRKIIIFPRQQIAFFLSATPLSVFSVIIWLEICFSPIMRPLLLTEMGVAWKYLYSLARYSVERSLPTSFYNSDLNIFADKGKRDLWGEDLNSYSYLEYDKHNQWRQNAVCPAIVHLRELNLIYCNEPELPEAYCDFRERLLRKASPDRLLNLPDRGLTTESIQERYRTLFTLLHPDRYEGKKREEAKILCETLKKALIALRRKLIHSTEEEAHRGYRISESEKKVNAWSKKVLQAMENLDIETSSDASEEYRALKMRLLNDPTPIELLGFTEETVPNEQLNSKYQTLRDMLYPENYEGKRKEEATVLYEMLKAAYKHVKELPPKDQKKEKQFQYTKNIQYSKRRRPQHTALVVQKLQAATQPNERYLLFKELWLQNASPQELLGLSESFTQKDLDKQFRLLSRATHPDKNGNTEEAKQLFQALGDAKEMLDRCFQHA